MPQNFAADFLELPEDDRDKVLEVLEEAGDEEAVEVFMAIQDDRWEKNWTYNLSYSLFKNYTLAFLFNFGQL